LGTASLLLGPTSFEASTLPGRGFSLFALLTANPLYGDLAESVKLDERSNSASRRHSRRHQQYQNRERDEHGERERVAHVAI
jgi:hypothetical protein